MLQQLDRGSRMATMSGALKGGVGDISDEQLRASLMHDGRFLRNDALRAEAWAYLYEVDAEKHAAALEHASDAAAAARQAAWWTMVAGIFSAVAAIATVVGV